MKPEVRFCSHLVTQHVILSVVAANQHLQVYMMCSLTLMSNTSRSKLPGTQVSAELRRDWACCEVYLCASVPSLCCSMQKLRKVTDLEAIGSDG